MNLTLASQFQQLDTRLCQAIQGVRTQLDRPALVGLSGSQGSGKSTTAERAASLLRSQGLGVAVCSLDDFYMTRTERASLAAEIHPLLATRGVPGTHDIALLNRTLSKLFEATEGSETLIPRFDKAADDRVELQDWPRHLGRVDVIVLEGWCVGARPEPGDALALPVNELERNEDRGGTWRRFVNRHLSEDYAALFARMDLCLMLRAPSFDAVLGWRSEQERKLSRDRSGAKPPLDKAALVRFISHYERITRWMLTDEPAHIIADLDHERVPVQWRVTR